MKLATHETTKSIDRYALQEAWIEVVAYGSLPRLYGLEYELFCDNPDGSPNNDISLNSNCRLEPNYETT